MDAYVKYGYFVIQKDSVNNEVLLSYHSIHTLKLNIPDELNPSIKDWIELLPNATQQNNLINYGGSIRDDGLISLKLAGYSDPRWLSCWAFYWDWCDFRSCPGYDNPMNPGCKGEKFRIKAIDEVEDGIIRTCSRVGFFYTYMKGKYWWYSTYFVAASCPGASTASMKSGGCSLEAWKIEVLGKPCGVPVTDHDVVFLYNRHRTWFPLFVIFRSDVARGKYNEGLQRCQGKY